jgi:hypothetical protein
MQPVFKSQPTSSNKAISSAYNELLKSSDFQLRPLYQRDVVWDQEQMINLIDTIMSMMPMPVFLLYMCISDCKECIDGQNRLTTIKRYIEQTPTSDTLFPWIKYHQDSDGNVDKVEYIYYRNPATETVMQSFCDEQNKALKGRSKGRKLYRLMTIEETDRFDSYDLNLSIIKEKLDFEQRKAIFLRWQSGTGISQCDRYKNEDYPFCELVRDKELERNLGTTISNILNSGRVNWLFDLYRLLNIFLNNGREPAMSTIKARTMIKKEQAPDSEELAKYTVAVNECKEFLSAISHYTNKLYQTQLFGYAALYVKAAPHVKQHMVDPTFMTNFLESIIPKDKEERKDCLNTLNNGPQASAFSTHFNSIMVPAFTAAIKDVPAPSPTIKRTKLPKSIRDQTWDTYIGPHVAESNCLCCGTNKIGQRNFEAGHVIAVSKGGADTIDNMRPICMPCNRSMGNRNMREFMAEYYPKMRLV